MDRRVVVPLTVAILIVGGASVLQLLRGGSPTGAATGAATGCEGGLDDGTTSVAEPLDATPEEMALQVEDWSRIALEEIAPDLLPTTDGELLESGFAIDGQSIGHCRYRQDYQGVPVFGGQAVVHVWPDGRLRGITNDLLLDIDVATTPSVPQEDAVEQAIQESITNGDLLTADPRVDLWVLRRPDGDHLVYRVQLERMDGTPLSTRPVLFVDAQDGDIVWRFDNLQTGVGQGVYRQDVEVSTIALNSQFYMENADNAQATATWQNSLDDGAWLVDDDDTWDASEQSSGVDIHWGLAMAEQVYEQDLGFSLDVLPHVVPSVSGSQDTLLAIADYGEDYNNAAWASPYLVFGNGDSTTFGPFTSLDVVSHELTHAVIEATADLTYADESGALNESWADVFAAVIQHAVDGPIPAVWTLGEDCFTPGISGDAIRYFSDPGADGSSRAHYDDRYTGTQDNGGVHWNSGIGNLVFFLVAEGGQPPGGGDPTVGIGMDRAAAIWLQALTAYMTSGTTFEQAREATLMAAADLYGADDAAYANIALAWSHVGIGDPLPADEPPPGGEGPCAGHDTVIPGTLSGKGDVLQLTDAPYYVDTAGVHEGCLEGRRGTNFDLILQKYVDGRWVRVASAATKGSIESLSYEGDAGYYSWGARSRRGSGRLFLGFTTP